MELKPIKHCSSASLRVNSIGHEVEPFVTRRLEKTMDFFLCARLYVDLALYLDVFFLLVLGSLRLIVILI